MGLWGAQHKPKWGRLGAQSQPKPNPNQPKANPIQTPTNPNAFLSHYNPISISTLIF